MLCQCCPASCHCLPVVALCCDFYKLQAMRQEHGIVPELVELHNIIGAGTAILQAAAARKNSRGAHFCADYPPDSRDRKAELSRLLAQPTEEPADAPPASLAPLIPAAQGPSSSLRIGRGKGVLGGGRVLPGPPPKRSSFKRSPSWPGRSNENSKMWAVDALPRLCPDGCCIGLWRNE